MSGHATSRNASSRNAVPRKPAGAGRPAPAAAQPPQKPKRVLSPETQNLTLSAWDMARTRKEIPDTSRGQVMTLRAHQRLVASFEKERNIPELDRSFLRVQEGADKAVLLIHGVSTSPGSLKDLAIQLYDAGLNVYVLRLPDYGTPEDTISEVSWESSLQQARQCFQLLARGGGPVHVVGMGFGATLALHLALAENVSSLVLLSPAIMPRENFWQRLLVRLKLHRLRFVYNRLGWTADLMEGMDKARGRIGKIRVPIYAAQCEDDDRAHPNSLRFLQRKARNKHSRFRVYPEGGHAILAHHGKSGLYEDIIEFCGGVTSTD
ncbi:hypothetical protein CSB20_08690 [bacterium DOLZORAL124_64_63]|nr:MAG: hypothetical protein CSB20_08690 [bacterium DOLZORAL124_64_63]